MTIINKQLIKEIKTNKQLEETLTSKYDKTLLIIIEIIYCRNESKGNSTTSVFTKKYQFRLELLLLLLLLLLLFVIFIATYRIRRGMRMEIEQLQLLLTNKTGTEL